MKTIMVVDDEKDIRETIKTLLDHNGYKIITANNADDCLKKLEHEHADLILLDIMMPGTPIKEAIPKIKTKIAIISALRLAATEKEQFLKYPNVKAFLPKPFDIQELLNKVKELLEE